MKRVTLTPSIATSHAATTPTASLDNRGQIALLVHDAGPSAPR